MNKSPLKQVQERFENKEKLVAAVKKLATPELWLDRVNEGRGLESVPNAKLLRLHDALHTAKETFGSRAKLIDAILTLQKRTKDQGYQQRLESQPLPRLLDIHAASARRAKSALGATKKSASKPATKKLTRSKKARAKARQALRA